MAASGRSHLPALGSSSVSGSVLQHQQHWDTGRSWTLAVWAGYTAGKVRFVPHRLSQVESHHPLWQTATLNSHCLCLTLSFLKSYARSWAKGVRFERSENSVCKGLCIPPALLKLKGPCDYILCSLKSLEAIIPGKWHKTKWLSSLVIVWFNLTLSCFLFFLRIRPPFFSFPLGDYEAYVLLKFITAFERKIFCERS